MPFCVFMRTFQKECAYVNPEIHNVKFVMKTPCSSAEFFLCACLDSIEGVVGMEPEPDSRMSNKWHQNYTATKTRNNK
ncbi:hypothetical protein SAMN05443246_2732 [Paenibacillus sp. GP183]|nr:hypothetical protein SAMN05443246_2732 [Paenibacillus sp. GP183]